jgi:hypothetical protein
VRCSAAQTFTPYCGALSHIASRVRACPKALWTDRSGGWFGAQASTEWGP